ncbi:MAG TPA: flagellar export chaperone FliS [Sedimentibacter sp.]|jgi:flagellar protein FliS|nr:flagellar export chaperone FliS [Sedimentibacter sp.]HOG62157.1 flagellar export chaperone FliS [Sedimentibacter sp.]HOT21510.1 flagellar export chaperone FliS [Sedimentibacter sp.]HPB79076.1 flagellar export chaperone FliS [Sedimentibacter sp.]HPV84731.1 flagellar export chaperone FliS [Sedimentibacter sp.]
MLNSLEQYKKTSVNTMTKGELLILLFDEAIKKLNQSKLLMEHEDYANANIFLTKVRHIFYYLTATLDGKYQISQELSDIYEFFNREIMKASTLKSTKHIDDILPIIKDLRDTWAEADILSRKKY